VSERVRDGEGRSERGVREGKWEGRERGGVWGWERGGVREE
jgi:hypothetical protein